jgi:hypothetical protein
MAVVGLGKGLGWGCSAGRCGEGIRKPFWESGREKTW